MNPKKIIKNYIGPSALLRLLCWVLVLGSVFLLATGVLLSVRREDPEDAARFNSLYEDSGDFVYLDAIAVDEWLCKYTVDGKTSTYYTIMAADKYYYIAVLSDAQLSRMTAQQEFWYEYDYEQPIPADTKIYRLYGVARPITDEVKTDIAKIYDMTSTEFDDYFGYMYINATALPSEGRGTPYIVAAVLAFALWLIISPFNRQVRKATRKSLKRLEQSGKLEAAAAELSGRVTVLGNDQCRVSDSFVYSSRGVAVEHGDILWLYRTSLPAGGNALVACTSYKKAYYLLKIHGRDRDGVVDSALELLASRIPSVLVGLNSNNQLQYRTLLAEGKKPTPAVEAAPVVETVPVAETVPAVETAPAVDVAPAVETIPATEAEAPASAESNV